MRGPDERSDFLFSYLSPEQRVPADHPLRPIRRIVDAALARLTTEFEALYTDFGRPSIPPEQLLRALLLQVLYTVRSERLLIEQLEYNLLFRWFVGLGLDERIWNHSTFSKNRERLLRGAVADAFFAQVLAEARTHGLLSDEHFTVDGTLLEAWASHKSFRPKDEDPPAPPDDPKNPTVNFRGERRKNDTHQSTTDPDARMYRKSDGHPARLAYMGHVLMENRSGLIVDTDVTPADGYGERYAALAMLEALPGTRVTVGADKA
jgi:transposase